MYIRYLVQFSSWSFTSVTELRAVGERSTQLPSLKGMKYVSLLENMGFSFRKEAPVWMSRETTKRNQTLNSNVRE